MDKKIVDVLVKADVIDPANKEVVSFGIRQVEYFFINVITILFLGKIFNETVSSIIFLLAFIPLRTYAGGYHAKTILRCYIITIVLMVFTLFSFKQSNRGRIHYSNCFEILKLLEKEIGFTVPDYTMISRENFYTVYHITELVESYINN